MFLSKTALLRYFLFFALTAANSMSQSPADSLFIKGVDVSFIPQIEDLGGVYKDSGVIKDPLAIFKDKGVNYIRLKLWHTPSDDYNNLTRILQMAERIKSKNLRFLLNFHYSDTWADPGHQSKPAAWQNASAEALVDSVYNYTFQVMSALDARGTLPDMVQIGNEINSGMLWNTGRVGGAYDTQEQWTNLAELINAGIAAVRASSINGDSVKIMIHRAGAANLSGNTWFFDNLINHGVDFDIIGLSFYPWWHGTIAQARSTMNSLVERYGKDVIIAETAYPWTLGWYDDVNNIVGSQDQLHSGYPASVSGQKLFIYDVFQMVRNITDGKGSGVFYWEPDYISVEPLGSPWENLAMFDYGGNALASLEVFSDQPDTLNPINVTIRLNTSTNWDTIQPHHFLQIRGEVKGTSFGTLPDGKKITWDDKSELVLANVGGDYWQTTFQMYPGDELSYKFWSGYSKTKSTYQRGGWEGPVTAYNGSTTNTRNLVAGSRDTTVMLQFYNSSAENKTQYWTPVAHKSDTIGVYFRVNMDKVMELGYFDPEVDGPVGVRGDSIETGGTLSWQTSKVILNREEYSINGGTFWSGVAYFPAVTLSANQQVSYKFYIESSNGGSPEDAIPNREFSFSESLITSQRDTTLHWVYFNDNIPTKLNHEKNITPIKLQLLQNYPNPFNPVTKIPFTLSKPGRIKITVFNLLGKEVKNLADSYLSAGRHFRYWDGKDFYGVNQSSGVYVIRLQYEKTVQSIKALLIR